jgi:hypothetical protein
MAELSKYNHECYELSWREERRYRRLVHTPDMRYFVFCVHLRRIGESVANAKRKVAAVAAAVALGGAGIVVPVSLAASKADVEHPMPAVSPYESPQPNTPHPYDGSVVNKNRASPYSTLGHSVATSQPSDARK